MDKGKAFDAHPHSGWFFARRASRVAQGHDPERGLFRVHSPRNSSWPPTASNQRSGAPRALRAASRRGRTVPKRYYGGPPRIPSATLSAGDSPRPSRASGMSPLIPNPEGGGSRRDGASPQTDPHAHVGGGDLVRQRADRRPRPNALRPRPRPLVASRRKRRRSGPARRRPHDDGQARPRDAKVGTPLQSGVPRPQRHRVLPAH